MHRDDKPISLKSAALWSVFWVVVAMAFAGFLYIHHGAEVASLFCNGLCAGESAVGRQPVCHDGHLLLVRVLIVTATCSLWGSLVPSSSRGLFAIGTSLLSLGPYVEVVFAIIVAAWTAVMMLKAVMTMMKLRILQHLAYRMVKRFSYLAKLRGSACLLNQERSMRLGETRKQRCHHWPW